MNKPIIAVDIDEVLCLFAEGFVAFSNERWGTHLRVEDYHEHWGEVWNVDIEEVNKRNNILWKEDAPIGYRSFEDAKAVLNKLSDRYKLIVVTARPSLAESVTKAWIRKEFGNIFDDLVLVGFYDNGFSTTGHALTKGSVLHELKADYIIDDQPKHCLSAAEHGIQALLFGDYNWNRDVALSEGVVRCRDWRAVGEYFDGQD
jgi:5'(3')-deoxyribonucleotidase